MMWTESDEKERGEVKRCQNGSIARLERGGVEEVKRTLTGRREDWPTMADMRLYRQWQTNKQTGRRKNDRSD